MVAGVVGVLEDGLPLEVVGSKSIVFDRSVKSLFEGHLGSIGAGSEIEDTDGQDDRGDGY